MEYEYKTEPFSHQRRVFEATRELPFYGLLWEQGTGKTKPTIDTAAWLYRKGEIDGVLVVAPNGVHRNWITDEIPAHLPDELAAETSAQFWWSAKSRTQRHQRKIDALIRHKGLAILCMNYDAFITQHGKNAAWRFLKRRRVLYVLDEAHHIKTPKAKRTRAIVASGKYAPYRRILTGTPGDKPFDLYSQLRFLDPDLWARQQMRSFAAFKHHFGVWRTRADANEMLGYDPGYDQLLDYKNLPELSDTLSEVSDRVLKEDVLDLPAKLYTRLQYEMTPRQTALYNQLRDQLYLELESGEEIDGSMAIVRLLRLQQVACGYLATGADEPIEMCDKRNPRLDAALDFLQPLPHQAIVWARFRPDVDQLIDALGPRAVRYDGAVDDDAAARNKEAFNSGEAQFFVGTPDKGAEGLTLVGAKTMLFYSNSFKLLQRLQAEDRAHRIGQDGAQHAGHGHGVLYSDLFATGTVDEYIVDALRRKFDIASKITGDRLRDWI